MTAALRFTTFTSEHPPRLTKIIGLDEAGKLRKQPAADMVAGLAEVREVAGLDALRDALDALKPTQAIGWGVPKGAAPGDVLTVLTKDQQRQQAGTIARARDFISYPDGPGIMMLDHDGGHDGERIDATEFRQRLIDACPVLADAPMLWRPSSSAGILAADGRELTGLHKHRLYIPVSKASDIPVAGKRLAALLWVAGATKGAPWEGVAHRFAWCEVGKAGQVLQRCLVDLSVWQPERLDFAAPPILQDGLTRPAAAGLVHGDPLALFDLAAIVATPADLKNAEGAQRAARKAIAPQAAEARIKWADEKAPALAQRRGISPEKARTILIRAAGDARVLMGDFELTTEAGELVTVGEVLDNPDRWHNARFADPLDPDTDRRVAFVNLKSGGRPTLRTHRHGGVTFELRRQSARVQLGKGRRIEATDAVLQVLRDRGELYEFGEGAVAYVADGRSRPVSPDWLTDHMGRACEFFSVRRKEDAEGNVSTAEGPEDPPPTIAKSILAKHGSRNFPRLVGVTTAPTLRLDGSILDKPGHDTESGLFYWCEGNTPAIPDRPTVADALAALRLLWEPVRLFPLVDDVARGVVLHGLLTACLRASLPTAPGIGFDAPAAGSGKTLLARCIGILTTGTDPAVLPPADNEEETRKRLTTCLRDGYRVILWDNVREPLGNAALDSFLTAATFADRILGVSESVSLPNRALFIATGNNLRLSSDTCRRVLVARMDAQSETPYSRDFHFDPAQHVERNRLALVAAVLTIVRAYIAAGRPKVAKGRAASFELWDDLVRQPLCWLAQHVNDHNDRGDGEPLPTFADPLESARRAFESDPETMKHGALLESWHAEFADVPTTVAQAIQKAAMADDLANALNEIGGQGGRINVRIVNAWVARTQGRIINGKLFKRGARSAAGQTWLVKRVGASVQNDSTDSTDLTEHGAGSAAEGGFSAVSAVSAVVSGQGPHAIPPDVLALFD